MTITYWWWNGGAPPYAQHTWPHRVVASELAWSYKKIPKRQLCTVQFYFMTSKICQLSSRMTSSTYHCVELLILRSIGDLVSLPRTTSTSARVGHMTKRRTQGFHRIISYFIRGLRSLPKVNPSMARVFEQEARFEWRRVTNVSMFSFMLTLLQSKRKA